MQVVYVNAVVIVDTGEDFVSPLSAVSALFVARK